MGLEAAERVLLGELPGVAGEIDRLNRVPDGFLARLVESGAVGGAGRVGELYGLVRLASRSSPAVGHVILIDGMARLALGERAPGSGSVLAVSITEPGGGSDVLGNLETRAVEEGGGEARVTGVKVFTSNALYATHFLVLARGPGGPTLYLVERGPGVEVEAMELTALRGAGVGVVRYRDAPAVRVGEPGRGLREALESINYGRAGYAAIALGIVEGALEAAVRHASKHTVFGRRLLDYQGVRWMLAEIRAEYLALDALLGRLAAAAEERGRMDPEGAAALKVLAARLAQRAAWAAVQLHGGRGLAAGSLTERLQRDARVLDIGEGAREVLLDFIASRLEKALAPAGG